MRHYRKPRMAPASQPAADVPADSPAATAANDVREAGRLHHKRARLHVEEMQHAEGDQRETQGNEQ